MSLDHLAVYGYIKASLDHCSQTLISYYGKTDVPFDDKDPFYLKGQFDALTALLQHLDTSSQFSSDGRALDQ